MILILQDWPRFLQENFGGYESVVDGEEEVAENSN